METLTSLQREMIEDIAGFEHDPLGYVLYAFPWGRPGTSLEKETGPHVWQREVLTEIGKRLAAGGSLTEAIQMATASGHGIGKSALVAWIILWAMSTKENTRGVVTANTDTQLRTKTWPEVKKWHGLAINQGWFTCAATSIHSVDPGLDKTWRIDAIPWSENNTEAFAGLHNKGFRIVVIFDEASAISDKIWEVTEGALTDEGTEIVWAVFGNYTRNNGRFHECFGSLRHRWSCRQIDSRTVEGTNKVQIKKWVDDYGEDSDFVRIRVRGVAPRFGIVQFISSEDLRLAAARPAICTDFDALAMGVDVARFGDDASVITLRRGRDARTIPTMEFRGIDTMQLASHASAFINRFRPAAVFVDETGVGGGVVDRLRNLGHTVIGVNNGAKSDRTINGEAYNNKGGECWGAMREWIKEGGAIEDSRELLSQCESREYGFDSMNRIVLESKADMKKRGLSSPDRADALALTFAYPIQSAISDRERIEADTSRMSSNYDPMAAFLKEQ